MLFASALYPALYSHDRPVPQSDPIFIRRMHSTKLPGRNEIPSLGVCNVKQCMEIIFSFFSPPPSQSNYIGERGEEGGGERGEPTGSEGIIVLPCTLMIIALSAAGMNHDRV